MVLERFGRSNAGIRRLEKWIHPKVKVEIRKRLKKSQRPAIVEVPLLFEAKFEKLFDLNIFIFAPRAARMKRALKRGMSKKLFELLDSRQLSARAKAARSDVILHNRVKATLKKQAGLLAGGLLKY